MPQELLATPLGQMRASKLSPLEHQLSNIHQQPAGEISAFASPFAEPTAPFPTAQVSNKSIISDNSTHACGLMCVLPSGIPTRHICSLVYFLDLRKHCNAVPTFRGL